MAQSTLTASTQKPASTQQQSNASDAPTIPLIRALKRPSTQSPRHVVGPPYLLVIIPFDEGELTAQAMENWFQACATDEPFSLELVGTRREQGFLLRASSEAQRTLLRKQFEAQYPQAEIFVPLQDPLAPRPGELILVGELTLARDAWMQVKTFSGEALAAPGGDPLAHILASMESVCSSPVNSGQMIVSQLILQRAPDSWIAPDIRKAVEHPLQEERDEKSAELKGVKGTEAGTDSIEGIKLVLLFVAISAVYFGYRWYQTHAYLPFTLLVLALVAGGVGLLWWHLRKARPPIYDMKLVSEKLMRQAFYCQLRVIVKGSVPPLAAAEQQRRAALPEKERARADAADRENLLAQLHSHLSHMEVAYRQFSLASANSLYLKRSRSFQAEDERARELVDLLHAFPYQHPVLRLLHGGPTKCVLNGLELAGMFHLPQAITDLTLVKRTSVKRLLFSPQVAREIEEKMREPLPPVAIGYSRHRGHEVKVALPFLTLFGNKFVIGRSRSGKSVLIQLLAKGAMQLVHNGWLQPGFFAIDPHRDLIEDLLQLIPKERWNDVLLFDFTDTEYPVALNPLDASMGFTRDQAISNLMSAFEKIWHETWGPRMAYFLNSVCLLLYTLNEKLVHDGKADEQYTLLDINPLLQYKDYAIKVLSQLDMKEPWHQELLAWWSETYFTLPPTSSFRNEIITPILSKIGVFNNNQILRRIVGQPVTRAPIHEAVTKGKIILCSLSSRDMDDSAVNILGSTMLNLLHAAFRIQQHTPLMQRRRVFVAVDEFQNFSGSAFDKLLSEDAKFGCSMLMATQNLARLTQQKQYAGLLETVLSNCQNFFAFNMSAADAKLMEAEYQMKVLQKDFISQPTLHCYTRMVIEHQPIQIASVFLTRPESWNAPVSRQKDVSFIRGANRKNMRTRAKVDELHGNHLQRFLDVEGFAGWIARGVKEQERKKRARQAEKDANEQQEASESVALPTSALRNQTAVSAENRTTPVSEQDPEKTAQQQVPPDESGGDRRNGSGHPGTGDSKTGDEHGKDEQDEQDEQAAHTPAQDGNEHTRNNNRSRRLKRLRKNQVGVPPPNMPQETSDGTGDTWRPLPTSNGNSQWSGYEGRERGERSS